MCGIVGFWQQTGHDKGANQKHLEVMNGELRQELEARGHRFTTRTDTEILVHLYEDYGTEMVNLLRGMFAFARHQTVGVCPASFGLRFRLGIAGFAHLARFPPRY